MTKGLIKKLPYFFLYALSFYLIIKEAAASIAVIGLLFFSLIAFGRNFGKRVKKIGLFPLLINAGFYLCLLISVFYSDSISVGFHKIQAGLLLLISPLLFLYIFPKVERKDIRYFSFGFIIANLILIIYFFNILVEGLAIDRFYDLLDKSLIDQIIALNKYPYEFVLSKAEKHLDVIYESHKVYLSLHFLIAYILGFDLIARQKESVLIKIILSLSCVLFICAIVYTQALVTLFALLIIILLTPFFYFKKLKWKLIYYGIVVLGVFAVWQGGMIDQYKNKNTLEALKFMEFLKPSDNITEGVDKRIYIYDCSMDLIKKKPLFGYGVGDVQSRLNDCYAENAYVVAEYKSLGSEINSHNYFFNLWLSAGIIAVLLLLLLFFNNGYQAIIKSEPAYFFFLLVILLNLFTENILSRMLGVFAFAIINSLYFSKNLISGDEEIGR